MNALPNIAIRRPISTSLRLSTRLSSRDQGGDDRRYRRQPVGCPRKRVNSIAWKLKTYRPTVRLSPIICCTGLHTCQRGANVMLVSTDLTSHWLGLVPLCAHEPLTAALNKFLWR